jgi:hypothetical protein
MDQGNGKGDIKIEFLRVNFDKILTQHAQDYCKSHPEVDNH